MRTTGPPSDGAPSARPFRAFSRGAGFPYDPLREPGSGFPPDSRSTRRKAKEVSVMHGRVAILFVLAGIGGAFMVRRRPRPATPRDPDEGLLPEPGEGLLPALAERRVPGLPDAVGEPHERPCAEDRRREGDPRDRGEGTGRHLLQLERERTDHLRAGHGGRRELQGLRGQHRRNESEGADALPEGARRDRRHPRGQSRTRCSSR